MGSKYRKACDARLLRQIQEDAHSFQFTTISDIERTIQEFQDQARYRSEYLVFRDVPYDIFLQLDVPNYCRLLYIHNIQILRITMAPSRTHETAAALFNQFLIIKLTNMGVGRELVAENTGLMVMRDISKSPDACWRPINADEVTCILEVGLSESFHHLVLDAHIWLESHDSHVSQAIIMDLDPLRPLITIQMWEATTRVLRSTRSDRPLEARKTQEVQVSLVNNVPTASGSLHISFAKVFERPPVPNTQEGDIIFSPDDLTQIARQVWRRQNLIPRDMARDPSTI